MIRPILTLAAVPALAALLVAATPAPGAPPPRLPPPVPVKASPRAPAAPSAGPQSVVPAGGASFDMGVWTVHASSVDANFKTGEFSTPKQVVMTRVGGDVSADRANGNYKKQLVTLTGHVVMHDSTGNYGGVDSAGGERSSGPSTLTADRAEIDGQAKIYKAIGNVHYVQADTTVDSDNGTLNDATHDLFLQGNVHIVQGTHKLDAQSVVYNTITGKAHAEGNVTIQFPGELHRGLATPKPIHVPKNPYTEAVTPPPAR